MSEIESIASDETEVVCSGDTSKDNEGDSGPSKPVETKFTTKTWGDDLTLIVEGKPVYVNRYVLASISPIFEAMFSCDFKEKDQGELTLHGKNYDDFLEFMRCVYPRIMKSVTLDNVSKVLPLAHEYQVKLLLSACDMYFVQYLLQKEPPPKELYEIMEMAYTYNLDQAKEKCIEIVAERPGEEFEEFKSKFSDEVINAIRAKMLLSLETKYKDVFGHVQTSRALYQFLGFEAKQKNLVEKYMNGQVVGGMVNLQVSSSTFETTTEMSFGGKLFTVNVAVDWSGICIKVKVEHQSQAELYTIQCLCAVHFPNWMTGKEDEKRLSEFQLKKGNAFANTFSTGIVTSYLSNEQAGFNCKGHVEMRIYLFCW